MAFFLLATQPDSELRDPSVYTPANGVPDHPHADPLTPPPPPLSQPARCGDTKKSSLPPWGMVRRQGGPAIARWKGARGDPLPRVLAPYQAFEAEDGQILDASGARGPGVAGHLV